MQRLVFRIGDDPTRLPGAVLCRDATATVDGRAVTVRRGATLEEALERLPADQPGLELTVLVPAEDELPQPDASEMLARGLAGDGIDAQPPHQGQVNLLAADFGLLRVGFAAVERLNRTGVALVASALDGRVVEGGETVAVVKAPALFVERRRIERALATLHGEPVLRVAPFTVRKVDMLAGERIRPRNLEQATKHLSRNVARFGAELDRVERLDRDDTPEIVARYRQMLDEGAGVILVAGSIMLDPEDPYMVAARQIGAHFVCQGAPIDPGTMFWLAYVDDVPILGLASCELYGRTSILDLLLPYTLAEERISRRLMSELGYGGLLSETQQARRPAQWDRTAADSTRAAG